MSKSIMIVICDFLLLSLLSLANFDSPQSEDAATKVKEESMRQQAFADSQMLDLLKMSLDSERDRRMEINADVSKLAKVAEENKNLAERQKKILDARERELKQLAKTKSDLEKERIKILSQSRDLESRVESTEKRNQRLQEEIMSASARLEKSAQERLTLEKRLGDMKQMDSSTKQKLEAVQTELRLNKEYLEKLKVEGEALKSENRAIETEKRALATQLEVATTKTQIYEENIKRYQTLVDIEKNEKEKIREHAETLAVGVGELATQQEKLTQNVRDLRPQTSSEIFENIKSRFVNVIFAYTKKGIFGKSESTIELRAIPVKIDGAIWLVINSGDTVIAPVPNPQQYLAPETLSISVQGKAYRFQPSAIYSTAEDPRLLALQVPSAFVEKEKIEPLRQPENFFTFSDCVVINPSKFYYGQIPFRADFKNNAYAQLDVGLIQSVFGTFSPNEGDIVMSRSSDYMGNMVDGSVAVLLRTMTPSKKLPLGKDYSPADAVNFVGDVSARLKKVPYRLK